MMILIDDSPVQRTVARMMYPLSVVLIPGSPAEIISLSSISSDSVDYIVCDRHMPQEWVDASLSMIDSIGVPKERIVEWTSAEESDDFRKVLESGTHLRKTGTALELGSFVKKSRPNGSKFIKLVVSLLSAFKLGF